MATEPIQGAPYPASTDAPDGPNQFKALADWAARRVVMKFTTPTTRDAAVTVPVEGEVAVTGTGTTLVTWQYRSGAWKVMRAGMYRLGSTTLGTDSGAVGATELAVITTAVTSPSGTIRLTVDLRLQATVAADTFLVRIREGSASGTQLAAFYATIAYLTRTTVSGSNTATITAGAATTLYTTIQRVAGTGTAVVTATSRVIVDEDPA